jgi:DNA-binding NarL/FixJ family response regulator
MTRKTADPPQPSLNVTCVVADHHPTLRQGLARILAEHGIEVVREATDGVDALAAIEEHTPTVAILGAELPRLSGVEVVRRAAARGRETAVILYASAVDQGALVEALNAGARGYVLKETSVDELIRAVTAVGGGDVYVDTALGTTSGRVDPGTTPSNLSAREQDILSLLASGMTTKEIAGALFISPETVRTYVRRAIEKLDARTRTQAVAIAVRRLLIP